MPGDAPHGPVRTMVVWCSDWPVAAHGIAPEEPAAVFVGNRVVACSPGARAHGVRRGMRRREAQSRSPELVVLDRDEAREARAFESVARVVEAFAPRLEIVRPGTCALPTRGPSRYFGGDDALATLVHEQVTAVLAGRTTCRIGVADGAFAATVAARHAGASLAVLPGPAVMGAVGVLPGQAVMGAVGVPPGPAVMGAVGAPAVVVDAGAGSAGPSGETLVVAPGASAAFLAPLPIRLLDRPALVGVLVRLGIGTLGAFAAFDPASVIGRFGIEGRTAHRLARGLDDRPPDARDPPPDLRVTAVVDPPAEQVAQLAFLARELAEDLHAALDARGLACTRVAIEAETENGEHLVRLWRHEGALSAGAVADRVRWQIDGWLHAPVAERPTSGIVHLGLVPDEVVAATGRQLGFWGEETEADARAARALVRLSSMLGADAVLVPERAGGRGPGDAVHLVPAIGVDLRERDLTSGTPAPGAVTAGTGAVTSGTPAPGTVTSGTGTVTSGTGAVTAGTGTPAIADPGVAPSLAVAPDAPSSGTAPSVVTAGLALPGARTTVAGTPPVAAPWPGRVPAPSPAVVHRSPRPASVCDEHGREVEVSGRGILSSAPVTVAVDGAVPVTLTGWAGPWMIEERWWKSSRSRAARLQLLGTDGRAWLARREQGRWWIEASYD